MKVALIKFPVPAPAAPGARLVDGIGRHITYLRLSVTDRCDLRCTYCMHERQTFLPKKYLLDYTELVRLADAFIARGVTKVRVTGGEPLVRQDVTSFLRELSRRVRPGQLEELVLTTNGTQLARYAQELSDMGIRRINVSLDSLDPGTFARLTRRDVLPDVLSGIDAALRTGLKVKINTVALRDANLKEIPGIVAWAHAQGMDVSLIETMPLGEGISGRTESYVSLAEVRQDLEARWSLESIPDNTGGPARYVRVRQTGGRIGFITPLSHNFCGSCNRVRITCTGMLYTCLGHEGGIDLRDAVRSGGREALDEALDKALLAKPVAHTFEEASLAEAATSRTMSVTGG